MERKQKKQAKSLTILQKDELTKPFRQKMGGDKISNVGDFTRTPSFLMDRQQATLVDALDVVVDKGVMVQGDVVIRVADLDLLALQLKLVLVSMSRLEIQQGKRVGEVNQNEINDEDFIKKLERQIEKSQVHINQMINANSPPEAESGLAKLVLALIKLITDLVEREARRRFERGYLSEREIEKLGLNLQAIETKLEELRLMFGLKEKDLNLDLGPLGKLR